MAMKNRIFIAVFVKLIYNLIKIQLNTFNKKYEINYATTRICTQKVLLKLNSFEFGDHCFDNLPYIIN